MVAACGPFDTVAVDSLPWLTFDPSQMRMRWLNPIIFCVFASLAGVREARAELSYSLERGEDGLVALFVQGEFAFEDDLAEFRSLAVSRKPAIVVFNSPGGNIFKALELGRLIRLFGLDTVQFRGVDCSSACAFAFMGGVHRYADPGTIGMHRASLEDFAKYSAEAAASDVQLLTGILIEYMTQMGVDPGVLQLALQYDSQDMRYLSLSEMQQFRVVAYPDAAEARSPAPIAEDVPTTPDDNASAPEVRTKEADGGGFEVAHRHDERLLAETTAPVIESTPAETPSATEEPATPSEPQATVEPTTEPLVEPALTEGSRSILLEEQGAGASGPAPFSGSVAWTREVDELGLPVIRARADIPARNLTVDVLIRKNSDETLPASHLIEIDFSVLDSFVGNVASLPGVLLKDEELAQGRPLVGASARVFDNSFLFALSAEPADLEANRALLRNQAWLDLPMVYSTGRRAILTLEKGEEGTAIFQSVMDAWKSAAPASRRRAPYFVQLSSQRSAVEALAVAEELTTRLSTILGPSRLEVRRVDRGDREVFYRVVAPIRSLVEATDLCNAIKVAGADCFVRAESETTEVQPSDIQTPIVLVPEPSSANGFTPSQAVDAAAFDTSIPLAQSGRVRHPQGGARLRTAPRVDASGSIYLANGDRVTILEVLESWYRVRAGGRTGYMHHSWLLVDQFDGQWTIRRFVQIASFDEPSEATAFIDSSENLDLSAYLSTNGWIAVTLAETYTRGTALRLLQQLKAAGDIRADSFTTFGNTYVRKLCCD